MADTSQQNGRVPVLTVMEMRFDGLERLINERFDALVAIQRDHETRIRSLERQTPWRNIVEAFIGLLAAIGVATGAIKPQ